MKFTLSMRMNYLRLFFLPIALCMALQVTAQNKKAEKKPATITEKTKGTKAFSGYFNFYWNAKSGKVLLEIDRFEEEFLYVNSLSAGVGSNDIGLDRNQLGGEHVAKFMRSGPKVLLIKPNYDYRAISNNPAEAQSVQEAFAQSVLWGFKIEAEEGNKVLIDFTPFLLRDAHGVAKRLRDRKQGNFKLDANRSVIYLERTKNFPKNSEFDALITFVGEAKGGNIRSVSPSSGAVSVRMHHSLVELPDGQYKPRVFDPRTGYYAHSYRDYATPIDQPLVKRFITRHRLEKKDPTAAISEAVEPIIYYLDRGAPEPIKSALIEGASWWNQAFEAAGYKDAFQVKVLPEDADPLDVRYNVINWVHRSTRGWSYGSSVTDPRTGEIIKGHVLLGSLRVRQDFMIAQGLIEAYSNGKNADPRMLEMALARLRQLSAHEVGHTIGLSHNFAASADGRESVMDYPHPLIISLTDGTTDFSNSYDVGIGEWDKRTIIYGYQDFPAGTDEAKALQEILTENNKMGLHYISDQDARPVSGAHPTAHLWDNGKSAVEELNRLSVLRATALANFSEKNIPEGTPMATLEDVLVPLYLAHRYQVEAVSKIIGGVNYSYAVRGDEQPTNDMIPADQQKEALDALLKTLAPSFLAIPEHIIQLIPPQPIGYSRGRELFKVHTGLTFDPIGAAESSADNTLKFILNPQRLARVVEQHSRNKSQVSLGKLLEKVHEACVVNPSDSPFQQEIARMVEKRYIFHLIQLAGNNKIMGQVSAGAMLQLVNLQDQLSNSQAGISDEQKAHELYLGRQINQFMDRPDTFKVPAAPAMPDGSPIGCGHFH